MQAPVSSNKQLSHTTAAAKAAAVNKRSDAATRDRYQQREAIERQVRKYAYLQHRRNNDLPGSSDFSNEPRTGKMKDAMEALRLKRSHY